MSKKDYLKTLSLFEQINEAQLTKIANNTEIRSRLKGGDSIYEAGDESKHVFVVANLQRRETKTLALVKVEIPVPGGKSVQLERAKQDDIFGEIEFLLSGLTPKVKPRETRAQAVTDVELLAIPFSILTEVAHEEVVLRTKLLREASARLFNGLILQSSYRHGDLDINLARFLVKRAVEQGIFHGNYVHFHGRITQEQIAADLGVSRRAITERFRHWSSRGLLRTAPLALLNFSRCEALADVGKHHPRKLVERACNDVDELIERGDLAAARNYSLDMLRYLPASPELAFRAALAAARERSLDDAAAILVGCGLVLDKGMPQLEERVRRGLVNPCKVDRDMEELAADLDEDWQDFVETTNRRLPALVEDIAALWARLEKDRAFASPDAGEAGKFAKAALQGYRRAYEYTGKIFPAVNAASMAKLVGDDANARELAQAVLRLGKASRTSYWSAASMAEASLILGETTKAEESFKEAAKLPDATDGAKSATRLQLKRLASAVHLDLARWLELMPVRRPAVISGHLLRPGSMEGAKLEEAEQHIRAEAKRILGAGDIGALYGPLACGSDIIMAEVGLEMGLEFHAVLPFSIEEFVETSVTFGQDDGTSPWLERFERCMSRAATVSVAFPGNVRRRELDGLFFFGARHAAGRAIARAQALQTEPLMIAVLRAGAAASLAGTTTAVANWSAIGHEVRTIDFPFPRPTARDMPRRTSAFAAVLFVYPAEGPWTAGEPQKVAQVVHAIVPNGSPVQQRVLKDRRCGFVVVRSDFCSAGPLARELLGGLRTAGLACRIICDFGPVMDAEDWPEADQIAQLGAASDLVGFSRAEPLATSTFAMEALCRGLGEYVPIGRQERHLHTGKAGLQLEASLDIFKMVAHA